jgi:hypothetical protein|tara:strand:+ start:2283 stop:2636 length:354 start_codon:yes stop_codon:yes gene_type:complete
MKRAREEYEAPDPVETLASPFRRARQIGGAPKRWKRYVVKKVQRLLTTYFNAPSELAAPEPWCPIDDTDVVLEEEPLSVRTSLNVDQNQNLTLEVDVPAHGETQLTRYFSWSRRHQH